MEHITVRAKKANPKKKAGKKSRQRRSAAHKLRSVRLVLGGLSAVQVGRKYGDASRAVSYWVQRFKEQGAKGLEEAPRSGRPSTIAPAQMKKLKAFVSATRAKPSVVSGRILADFIKRNFGVTFTRQHGRRILNQLDSQDHSVL